MHKSALALLAAVVVGISGLSVSTADASLVSDSLTPSILAQARGDSESGSGYRFRKRHVKILAAGGLLVVCGVGWVYKKVRGE